MNIKGSQQCGPFSFCLSAEPRFSLGRPFAPPRAPHPGCPIVDDDAFLDDLIGLKEEALVQPMVSGKSLQDARVAPTPPASPARNLQIVPTDSPLSDCDSALSSFPRRNAGFTGVTLGALSRDKPPPAPRKASSSPMRRTAEAKSYSPAFL